MVKKHTVKKESTRPPIVAVLGHVDHGKTTLLDKIRKTRVQEKEAGGITQSIGASVVETKEGKKITFIDTPGHAAFSKMRSRGANVADIAVLVIAAYGGIKPQTKESLGFIKEAEIPYIVAATKIDLPSASVETLKEQLDKEGIKLEGKGGSVPLVPVSGKTGEGVEDLLEMISLVSDVSDIQADTQGELEAIVIETNKDKRGLLVSVVVRNGLLRVGDEVFTDNISAKVRGLFDDRGKPCKSVGPGEPAMILGFSELPHVGTVLHDKSQGSVGKHSDEMRKVPKIEVGTGQIPVVIKADSNGSLEAVLESLPREVVAISASVGDVNESDIFFAKSFDQARIFTFGSKVPSQVKKLAVTEGVKIETFDIIYKLFERLDEIIKKGKEQVLGKAEIIASFPFDKKKVAGCKVLGGEINKKDDLVLMRGEKKMGKVKIDSMKKEKKEIENVKAGEEFGVILSPQLDFDKGDMLLSIR